MNIEQLLLIKLMEECAEVQQACSKALRFGLNSSNNDSGIVHTNAMDIRKEFLDVLAVIEVLTEEGILDMIGMSQEDVNPRKDRINKYMLASKQLGILQ